MSCLLLYAKYRKTPNLVVMYRMKQTGQSATPNKPSTCMFKGETGSFVSGLRIYDAQGSTTTKGSRLKYERETMMTIKLKFITRFYTPAKSLENFSSPKVRK